MIKRTIYSIDEATELTQRSRDDLIALGCSGELSFLVYIPDDVMIGNVGWQDTEEALDPVERLLKSRLNHLPPVAVSQPDLLVLSEQDCRCLLERGSLRQTAFFRAASFGAESQIDIVRPPRPHEDAWGMGKLHSPIRVFATYERDALLRPQGRNAVIPTKEVLIHASQLHVAARELAPYLAMQEQSEAIPLVQSALPQSAIAENKRKGRGKGRGDVSRIIEKIYKDAGPEEREMISLLWDRFKKLAAEKFPPLCRVDKEDVYFEKADGSLGLVTRDRFIGQLTTIKEHLQKTE
ncbi:hypothetical protein [Herbaspirillum huttiense]|uniref:hypothetical protein n=1 Tax=Herbaspirillum huttiense TaxID=863372 RepID=UPI0031E36BA9